ncbi:SMI1/KNR4 family protein [Providencia hangzhouensis]|uniref:SMI1/KNR4 family protein n=1 Tax=Providencia TaxID=586 RepID=UPI000D937952|nr:MULTISPECIES: SMI1/KNR4 family protein [Providencia]PYZ58757.1 SMI1/KNR4 family protein [Providencia rettgeri]QIF66562.1 SMI1/KNR4 family protein [Providencia sp. 1709051003]WOB93913.1 SMI1/KNR4 family protein [Providencia sp. PROV099]
MSKFFTDPHLKFEKSLHGLTSEEINTFIPQDFSGKNFFIEFYEHFNGGYFYGGAFIYRDNFYKIEDNDYNLMEIESFNFIPINDVDSPYLLSVSDVLKYRCNVSKAFLDFSQLHIPFAGDAGDSDYWINLETGKIKYTKSTDIDCLNNIIDIAPSFCDFCTNIQSQRR